MKNLTLDYYNGALCAAAMHPLADFTFPYIVYFMRGLISRLFIILLAYSYILALFATFNVGK